MDKTNSRRQMIQQLNTMNAEEHTRLSRKIKEQVIQSEVFKKADVIGITISRYPEVDTRPIIEAAWLAEKQIAAPKCERKSRGMDFRIINSYNQLETVYIDLLEPIIDQTEAVSKEEIGLQIVPGVVFSNEGYRIGFGGGYYDRYMADFNGQSIALAFERQMRKQVPVETYDIPVNMIFTEQGIINCEEIRQSK